MTLSFRTVALSTLLIAIGILIGGYAFSDTQPRSFLRVQDCVGGECLNSNELLGLIASVGFQRSPTLAPRVVKQTAKTVVIEYQPGWFVLFPKQDIKDIADVTEDNAAYLTDIYAVMGDLVRERKMTNWQIFTNGQDIQHIRYLHFHLMDRSQTNVIPR